MFFVFLFKNKINTTRSSGWLIFRFCCIAQFFNLISRNELVPTLLKFRQATVFAPNNEAMRAFTGQKDQDLLLYHLGSCEEKKNIYITLFFPKTLI